MHIPDGFLDTKTIVATTTLSVVGVATAWRQTKANMPASRVPLLGLAAAFVFAAQMLNFPVAGGTSGHLIGAVLASVLLGPSVLLIAIVSVPISIHIFFACVIVLLLVIAFLSTIPMMFLIKRMLFLELFAVGVAVLSLLQPNGLMVFLTLLAKSTICLSIVIVFSNTTRFTQLPELLKKWHVPYLLVTILALMYRYLFVLVDEAEHMQRARTSHTFGKQRSFAWKSLATVVAQLFVRSTERAERIYAAMCARGWQ